MQTIHKYNLELTDVQEITMPAHAKILYVGWQIGSFNSGIKLWAQVTTYTTRFTKRKFWIFGTGHEMPEAMYNHVGTVLTPDGFVWHVFEEV